MIASAKATELVRRRPPGEGGGHGGEARSLVVEIRHGNE